MVRYRLRCKNSLLLLKCKFLLRVGDKKIVFLIEFTFLFYYFYLLTLLWGNLYVTFLKLDIS